MPAPTLPSTPRFVPPPATKEECEWLIVALRFGSDYRSMLSGVGGFAYRRLLESGYARGARSACSASV